MRVFILISDSDHYQRLHVPNSHDRTVFRRAFRGHSMVASWAPVRVEVVISEEDDHRLPAGDFPSLGGTVPTFSETAVNALRPMLESSGELLPLAFDGGRYYAFNVTRVLDSIDEQRSEIKRFSDGEIMRVAQPVFIPERLEAAMIFKIPQTPEMYTYVTDEFVSRVQQAGLTGFTFKQVWTDEE